MNRFNKQLKNLGTETAFSVSAEAKIWKEKGNEIYEKGKQITGSDSCRDYSDYTCSQLENSRYNVYVWLAPSKFGDEPFTVGTSNSLSQCSSMARNFA